MKVNAPTAVLVILAFFVSAAAADEVCIICDLMVGQPQANIMPSINYEAHEITANLYYENYSEEPPRVPIGNAMLFVYVDPAEGEEELLRIYTDDDGAAIFDFGTYAATAQELQITYNFRLIYCPFCHPEDEGYPCGFDECMGYAGIVTDYGNTEEVPLGEGVVAPPEEEWNRGHYLPTSISMTYVPPPAPQTLTPAFCLPLILIFALLGGAMYYTGRNPFGMFSLGSPRVGRHIRYTPTGRGFSLNVRYVAQSIKGGVSEGKKMVAAGEAVKKAKAKAKEKGEKYEGPSAAKAAWGAGQKGAGWRESLTLGGYGMVMGGATVTRDGKTVTMGDGRGIKQIVQGIPGSVKKAKKAYEAGKYFGMPSKRGEIGKAGGAKGFFAGYGQQVFEGVVKAGGALLASSVLSGIFGNTLASKMMNFAVDKDATALAEAYADRDVEKQEQQKVFNKLDKLVKSEKATEVVVDGITYYEMDQTYVKEDGTTGVATIRVDKESFKEGKLIGTQTISREDHIEIRSFSGEIDKRTGTFDTQLTTITKKKGSGNDAIVATYSIAEPAKFPGDYTLKLESTTVGENIKGNPESYKQALEFAKSFDGNAISAESVARTFMGTNIDKGTTLGSLALELGQAQYNVDAACDRIRDASVDAGVHAYYKADNEFKDATKDAGKAINYDMQETKISDQARALLLHTPEPGESASGISGHYKDQADAAVTLQGQTMANEKYKQPTPGQQAGAQAVYGLGTDLATMSKNEALHEAQQNIAKMNLTGEQKKEAYQVAQDLYSDAKKTAKTWQIAATEASGTYSKLQNTAAESLKPVYAGKDKEVKDAIVQAAVTSGIATYYELEAAKKEQPILSEGEQRKLELRGEKQYMQDEIAKAVITGSQGAIVKTPEQAYLSELVTNGPYKPPEPPKSPELPTFKPDATDAEKQKAYEETFSKYLQEAQEYQEKAKQWKDRNDGLLYGTGLNTAAGSSLVLTSAIKKGVELPEEVYKDAIEGIDNSDPGKWKDAATKAMDEVDKQQEEKRKKELKGLQGQREIGL